MRSPIFILVFVSILILIDFYIFHVLKTLSQGASSQVKSIIFVVYWALCVVSVTSFMLFPFISNPYFRQYIFSVSIGWVLTQITMVLFFLLDDVRRGTFWTVGQISSAAGAQFLNSDKGIPRSTFLSWLGVGLSSSLFFLYSMGLGISTITNLYTKN